MSSKTRVAPGARLGSLISLILLIAPLDATGFLASSARGAAPDRASKASGPGAGHAVTPAELDELTRAFADRYVGLLSSTCDALKKDNADPVQRREAQELMLDAAANVYDIASNADAYTRMLDLVVVTTLLSQVWVDDDRTGDVFGDRGEVLVRALHHGRVEAWALAARVLRPDQLDVLDYTIWDWRRQNPDMVRASFVRFSNFANFAIDRGKSANADVLAASGFLKNVGQTGQAVDEARLLSERMFYLLKREPTLLRWQADAAKDGVLATPDVTTALADIHRLADQVERLPRNVANEREAILAAVDERTRGADATLARVQATVADAKALNASVGQTSASLNVVLATADGLFTRFDAWDRWSTGLPQHRAFDVREYTTGIKDLAAALTTLNASLKSSSDLLASPEWARRMQEVNAMADGRMSLAAQESRGLMNALLVRTCVAMLAFFAMLTAYRAISLRLARRARGADDCPLPRHRGDDNGQAPPPYPAATADPPAGGRNRTARVLLAAAMTLSAVCLSTGCIPSRPTQRLDDNAGEGTAPRRAATILPPSAARPDDLPPYSPLPSLTGTVTSIGASTTTHLAARAAAEFRQIYPGVTVTVMATTTDAGPRALIDDQADVVPMSRPLLPGEVAAFRAKYGYPPTEIKVAADALAIFVEKRNPIRGLTLAQLDAIFSRTRLRGSLPIDTWGQAGLTGDWADRPIPIYGYGPGDGVHQVFRQEVLAGGEYRLSLQVVPAGSLIVQDVAADPAAIGCASIFFASKRTRAVPLAGDDGVFYAPTEENVRTLRYPLTRFVTACVNKRPGRPLPSPTAEFVRFLLSSEGQQIATAGGNIRLGAATAAVGRRAID